MTANERYTKKPIYVKSKKTGTAYREEAKERVRQQDFIKSWFIAAEIQPDLNTKVYAMNGQTWIEAIWTGKKWLEVKQDGTKVRPEIEVIHWKPIKFQN